MIVASKHYAECAGCFGKTYSGLEQGVRKMWQRFWFLLYSADDFYQQPQVATVPASVLIDGYLERKALEFPSRSQWVQMLCPAIYLRRSGSLVLKLGNK